MTCRNELLLTADVCLKFSRYPFDLKHPIGYLIDVTIQYIIFLCVFVMTSCLLSMGLGVYFLFISFVEDIINNNLATINRSVETQENPIYIFEQFTEFIEFHSNVKQFS